MGVYGTMFGVGGGFLIVPVLLWLYPDMEAATVVSAALIVVASNAASGSAAYAWQRRIDFRSGLWLAGASLPGAALGTLAVREVDRGAFEVVFAAALLLVGVYMIAWRGPRTLRPVATSWGTVRRNIRDRKGETYSYGYRLQVALLANAGIGFFSSFLGIGGGFIQMPFMIVRLHFPVHIATATSLFLVGSTALAGAVAHIAAGDLGWDVSLARAAVLSASAVTGAQLGALWSPRVRAELTTRIFSLVVIAVAAALLGGLIID